MLVKSLKTLFLGVIFLVSATVFGTPVLRIPLGVSLTTFDPSEAEDFVTIRVLMNLGSGLTTLDKDLKPQPRLAQSWSTSTDGLTWKFKLKNSLWSDGTPIKAEDFVRGFERSLSPRTIAKLGAPFLDVIKNARDYKSGKLKDFSQVGVKAENGEVVFELKHRAYYFPCLLALPFAFPQKENTAAIQVGTPTSGPFMLGELTPSRVIRLVPNPNFKPKPVSTIEFKIISEGTTALSLYEQHELDVIEKIPSSDFERFKNNKDLVKSPFLATYYLAFNVTKKPFSNLNLRKAISESVDRKSLDVILKDPQKPASSLVPDPLVTSLDSFGPSYDVLAAKKLWSEAKERPDRLDLAFDSQEKNTLIASLLQEQLKKTLGLELNLKPMEWKAYLRYMRDQLPPFYRFAWLAAFPDPLSHLQVFTSGNPNNYTGYANPKYDALVEKVAETQPGGKRTRLIYDAQKMLITDDVVIIPLYHYVQYFLISRHWQGLTVTPMGLIDLSQARPTPEP